MPIGYMLVRYVPIIHILGTRTIFMCTRDVYFKCILVGVEDQVLKLEKSEGKNKWRNLPSETTVDKRVATIRSMMCVKPRYLAPACFSTYINPKNLCSPQSLPGNFSHNTFSLIEIQVSLFFTKVTKFENFLWDEIEKMIFKYFY